jgi:predicted Zn-dependent protease
MDIVGSGLKIVGVDPGHVDSGVKVVKAGKKAIQKFTPSQQHYIGRTVGAKLIAQYKPYDNDTVNRYLNELGQTLAAVSDMPDVYLGYRFMALDTDEVNAFALPGGLILVSRGLLKCCKSEDDLAAVIAHEIGHVQLEHGIKIVERGKDKAFFLTLGTEAAKTWAPEDLAQMADILGESADKVVSTLATGYDAKKEFEADAAAITIMTRLGYDPKGLLNMLQELDNKTHSEDKKGFGKSHPPVSLRIRKVRELTNSAGGVSASSARQKRFKAALQGI